MRARLGLIGPQLSELDWLEGLYLYGSALIEKPRLMRLDFIVVHRGLRQPTQLKNAKDRIRGLLKAVIPVRFDLKFTGALEIGRLLDEGNPAAQALLGHTETVFSR